jgi:hypothetical protein
MMDSYLRILRPFCLNGLNIWKAYLNKIFNLQKIHLILTFILVLVYNQMYLAFYLLFFFFLFVSLFIFFFFNNNNIFIYFQIKNIYIYIFSPKNTTKKNKLRKIFYKNIYINKFTIFYYYYYLKKRMFYKKHHFFFFFFT